MNDVTKALLNTRSLRAATKELSLEQLEDALIKLTTIVTDKREAVAFENEQQAQKQAKMADILKQLEESGISTEEFISLSENTPSKAKAKREPRPAKYSYEHEGETKTWTGQGRMPLTLQNIMNETGSIDQFLI